MRRQIADAIDRSERTMLLLAALAVALYLCDLQGLWDVLQARQAYLVVAIGLDVLFALDLLLKIAVLRGPYLKSPWFVVDLVSALPVVTHLAHAPQMLQSLRAMRAFRVLRTLRILRILRTLRVLKIASGAPEGPENARFERALTIMVISYTIVFLLAVSSTHRTEPPGEVLALEGQSVVDTVRVQVRMQNGSIETMELPAQQVFRNVAVGEFFLVLGSIMGMLLIMVVQQFHVPAVSAQQVRALLNVALPRQVAEHFMAFPAEYDHTVRMPATIMFSDIMGFTSTVEKLGGDLDALKEHLERAMDAVVEVHVEHDLIVDKFIGDAVMSFRGGNLVDGDPAEHAARVVRAALEANRALAALDDPYFRRIKTGGASADNALIGTFGTSKRLSYTILGDRVNLAARLEAACNSFQVATLFCPRTRELVDGPEVVWRRIGKLRAKGKSEVIDVFEAVDPVVETDTSWVAEYESALAAYEEQRFADAKPALQALVESRSDGPSDVLLSLIADLEARGVPEDWQPVAEPPKG